MPRVAVNIVTWNSEDYIQKCLNAVLKQTYGDLSITVLDNASNDETVPRLSPYLKAGIKLIRNPQNVGYAAAHNQLIRITDSNYVLTLNPDVYLMPDFIEQLVCAISCSNDYGSVSGQLLAVTREHFLADAFTVKGPNLIDEAGILIQRSRRQFPRGYHKVAGISCTDPTLIFGPCGAAAFYRRAMLEDICIHDQYFDEAFFIHKEDVDVAWRSQLLGWKSYYTPDAVGFHVRGFHPGQRKKMPVEIRRHAVKNRWLMAIKNELQFNFLRDLPYILLYEMEILVYLLLFERDSLPALLDLLHLWPRTMKWRRSIQERSRSDGYYMRQWFGEEGE